MIMKPKTVLVSTAACFTFFVFNFSAGGQTMPRKSASPAASSSVSPAAPPAKQISRQIPFHGMISGVDQKNKTFTISGKEMPRTFKITNKTVITKGAVAGTMKDIVENEEVSGAYWKDGDGMLEAKVVKLGPMEKKNSAAMPKASVSPAGSPKPSTSPKP
jgi:hypothetical protein